MKYTYNKGNLYRKDGSVVQRPERYSDNWILYMKKCRPWEVEE